MEPQKKAFEDPKAKTQEYLEQHKLAELMEVSQRKCSTAADVDLSSPVVQSHLACS
jgi:hypothetical protein